MERKVKKYETQLVDLNKKIAKIGKIEKIMYFIFGLFFSIIGSHIIWKEFCEKKYTSSIVFTIMLLLLEITVLWNIVGENRRKGGE